MMPWLRCPAADRIPATTADRRTVAWMAATLPTGCTPREAAVAAQAWYRERGGSPVLGVPLGPPAWRRRLRLLWLAGLVEKHGWYRVAKG